MPESSPLRYRMGSGEGGEGAEKYRLQVPTPGASLEGADARPPPSMRFASGPCTATTTPRLASMLLPSDSTTRAALPPAAASTLSTLTPSLMDSGGRRPAICCATAPMPPAGRQLDPTASMRITNSNRRDEVRSSRSKKMPPRKGRKKRRVMASLNPSALSFSLMLVSGRASSSSRLPSTLRARNTPTRTLSTTLPTGLVRLSSPSTGWRSGSATRWKVPPVCTRAPA
mmetsp:Transcript_30975/g.68651  ORF Transcript_30975/g.68651 Transcript_30975/m.68651 type:complete len:228 (+) Transcript_30975:911-1594(+)